MIKNNSSQKPSRQARRRAARSEKKGKGERFSLGISDLELGPLKLGNAQFKSRQARAATVGAAPHSLNIQTRMPYLRTEKHPKFGTVDILGGTDRIGPINTDELGALDGDILFTQNINPGEFVTSRMSQWNPLYQRYRIRKMAILYEGAAGTQTNGQLIGYFDQDVDNQLDTDSPANSQRAAAQVGNQICQCWEDQIFPNGEMDPYTTLFTLPASGSGDERLHMQSTFYLLAATDLAPNLDLGVLYVAYEIEFYIPTLANPGGGGPGSKLHYDSSWGSGTLVGFDFAHPLGTAPALAGILSPGSPASTNNLPMVVNASGAGTLVTWTGAPLGTYVATYYSSAQRFMDPSFLGLSIQFTGALGCAITAPNGKVSNPTTIGNVDWVCLSQAYVTITDASGGFQISLGPSSSSSISPVAAYFSLSSFKDIVIATLSRPSRYLARGKDWQERRFDAKFLARQERERQLALGPNITATPIKEINIEKEKEEGLQMQKELQANTVRQPDQLRSSCAAVNPYGRQTYASPN